MRIGKIEIRVVRQQHRSKLPRLNDQDRVGALAVPDTEPWWLAVHQILDEAELETIQGARNNTGNTNKCIAAVGAGEGVELVRIKLKQARDIALTRMK